MKLRIQKALVDKMKIYFWNILTAEFLYKQLTPATLTAMEYRLETLQREQIQKEPMNVVWTVKLKLRQVDNSPGVIELYIPPEVESNLLYVDWPPI